LLLLTAQPNKSGPKYRQPRSLFSDRRDHDGMKW
jgi:hypothetical protein